ncbi:NF038120 family PEP-CTERM protein [Roseateles sp. LYH14W]|uniref:NF038120 family PEP-CTERM protein n=1 Tax=Pelomonas parva TaxID=3299032 RepID=A0ABW7F0M3_9BURK
MTTAWMFRNLRSMLVASGVAMTLAAPVAQAAPVVIDFNVPPEFGIVNPGEAYVEDGFRITQLNDFALIATPGDQLSGAPANNGGSAYYATYGEGYFALERENGGSFNLDGLWAGFIPQDPQLAQTIILAFDLFFADGSTDALAYNLPVSAFGNYNLAFEDLEAVVFYTCVFTGTFSCPTGNNNGQFAVDNLRLTIADPVELPEPASMALVSAALLGLGWSRRRTAR